MGNLTSTLTISLNDDVSGPAGRASGAMHRLGASGNDLKKLAAASPEAAKLVKQLEALQAAADKIKAFRGAREALGDAGNDFRAARQDLARLSAELETAKNRMAALHGVHGSQAERDATAADIRRIERQLRTASAAARRSGTSWRQQAVAVREMRRELVEAGVELGGFNRAKRAAQGHALNLGKAEAEIETATRRATAELARQSSVVGSAVRRVEDLAAAHRTVARTMEHSTRAGRDAVAAGMGAGDERRQQTDRASRRLIDGMGAPARAAREREAVEQAHQARRASAGHDLAAGMSSPGRGTLDEIERNEARRAREADASRRLIDGMGAPAHEAARIRAEAEADRERVRAARSDERKEAAGTIAATTGLYLGHKGKEIGLQAINAAGDFDYAVRYQHAVTDVSEEDQQRLLIPQAKRIGQETKFSNRDIVEAQTATMQGLPFKDPAVKAEVGAAIVDNARYYAVLFKSNMEKSSEGIRNYLQNTNKDISTPEKAVAEAQRGTNLIVKAAKLGGASDEDAQQFMKFGLPIASQAGMKDTTAFSIFSTARRSGLKGDESGVFLRALTSKLISPTREGREAEIAAGIDRTKYQKMPERLSAEAFEKIGKGRFGVKFNESQRKRLSAMFQDGDLLTKDDEFIKQVSSVVGESFDKVSKGPNKGKAKAQDAAKIAKLARDFHRMSVESTDIEGLWDAHLASPTFTPALRNTFYTDKHGGKAGMVAQHLDQFREDRDELLKISATPTFARDKAMYMTEGLGGSLDNVKGSFETVVLNLGTKNAPMIQSIADGLASVGDGIANLPDRVVRGGTLLGIGAGTGAVSASALAMWGQLTGSALLKSAGASTAMGTLGGTSVGAFGLGGYLASDLAASAVKNKEFAAPYLGGGLLAADPGGYGLGAAIAQADTLPGADYFSGKVAAPAQAATKSVADLKAELSGVEQLIAGLQASGAVAYSPDAAGLEAKKAQIEAAIDALQAKLKSVADETVAPRFDASGAQAFGTTVDGVKAKAQEAGALTINIPINAPGAGTVIQQLTQIITLARQAEGAAGRVGSGGGTLKARSSSPSFSDGVTPGAGAE